MQLLVLLSLLGLALSAPVLEEKEAEKKTIVKRSDEEIGFGNRQNLPKIKKKSDPAMLADNVGSVLAETPQEINPDEHVGSDAGMEDSGNNADSAAKVEEELNAIIKEEQMAQQDAGDGAAETLPGSEEGQEIPIEESSDSTEESNVETDTDNKDEVVNPDEVAAAIAAAEEPQQELSLQNNGISPENSEAIKDLMQENMVSSEPVDDVQDDNEPEQFAEVVEAPEGTSRQDNDAEQSLEMLEENPLEAYRMYRNYQNFLSTYPDYYSNLYRNYQNGRRRRASSTFLSRLRNREIKRNHRIKRELPYGDSSLFPYFYPEQEQDQEDAMYRVIPEQEILGNDPYTLYPEEALEEELAAEEGLPYAEEEEEDYGTPIMYDGKMGYFLPSKRQDMLSFVPGNKRDSYFFPFSKEPETHYQAFVPEKRSYLESYGDLVRLARALAMEPQDREQYLQGYEWE